MLSRKVSILLLGQTGVGKSTLINMIGNYLSEKSVHEIAEGRCNLLVPTKFTLQNADFVEDVIKVGNSESEIPGTGQSATQRPCMYTFNDVKHNVVLEVIDTPGVGDTRGLQYDAANAEMILSFISELPSIHAICILLKPDVTRITPEFEVCIKQILGQLDRNIIRNIVFLYTNGRMRNFKNPDTDLCLRQLFTDIQSNNKNVIPFNNNSFFIDNESFKYIVAKQQGRVFSQCDIGVYEYSFNISRKNIDSLISYIINLNPAPLQGIVSINEAKRLIRRLVEPLIKLTILYEKAISDIEEYKNDLSSYKNHIEKLKENIYTIEHIPMVTENTVAVNKSDIKFSFDIPNLFKMGWKYLLQPFKFIFNIFRDTKTSKNVELVKKRVLDKDTIAEIKDQESARNAVQKKMKEMQDICREYDEEVHCILKVIGTFTVFIDGLKYLAGQDIFEKMMELIIEQYNNEDNKLLIIRLEKCLRSYKYIKRRIGGDIKSVDVMDCCQDLFRLKHTGHVFKEIIDEKVDFEKIYFIS